MSTPPRLLALLLALAPAACSSGEPPPVTRPCQTDPTLADERSSCAFTSGALPGATVGECAAEARIPVDHIVLFMQENRSFDHYLGHLGGDVDAASEGTTNPDFKGAPVPWHHASALCTDDTNHSWTGTHQQLKSGFVVPSDPGGERAMAYYDETNIPFYYELGRTFAISDRYFCDVLGPTHPNRMYAFAGTSFGLTASDSIAPGMSPNIFDALTDKGVSWKIYRETTPNAIIFLDVVTRYSANITDIGDFAKDAAAGTLPQVAWIDGRPDGGADEDDEHPPGDIQVGQHLAYQQIKALMAGPEWKTSVMFLDYDEHGGFFDHVVPPKACPPDKLSPVEGGELGGFDQYGIRVPLYVISPFARKGYVSHTTHSHASILRFVEARFGLPAFTGRDANADAMLDLFDFDNPPFATPPALTEPPVDMTALAACRQKYGGLP